MDFTAEHADRITRSEEAGKGAHRRLDGINGQIGRLADSHERLRSELADDVNELKREIAVGRVKQTLMMGLAVFISQAIIGVLLTAYSGGHVKGTGNANTVAAVQPR